MLQHDASLILKQMLDRGRWRQECVKRSPPPFPSPGFKSNKSRHYLIMRNKDQTETLKLSVWFLLCFVLFNKDFDLDFHEPWTFTTTRHGCGSNYDSDLKLLGWPQRFDFNAHVHINWMLRTVKYCGATHTHTHGTFLQPDKWSFPRWNTFLIQINRLHLDKFNSIYTD